MSKQHCPWRRWKRCPDGTVASGSIGSSFRSGSATVTGSTFHLPKHAAPRAPAGCSAATRPGRRGDRGGIDIRAQDERGDWYGPLWRKMRALSPRYIDIPAQACRNAIAPASDRGRVRTARPSLPLWTIH
jgi:hypothetical protein